jgi:MFS family permease
MRAPAVLKSRDFQILMLTRSFGAMALQAQAVIAGWQIYSFTHDPFLLGLAGLTEALPALGGALFAGHIVDISRPHRVFAACIGVMALNMLGLYLVAGGVLSVSFGVVPYIFAGIFVSGVARSFVMPASFALQSQVATRAQMSEASSWLIGSFHIATVSGPAMAGIIYGAFGARAAWLMPVSLMTIECVILACMSPRIRAYKSAHAREPVTRSIKAGWAFILSNRTLLSVMALDMFAVLFGGAVAMLPAYADQVLHVGAEGLGALRASSAVGAALTSLALAVRPLTVMRGTTLLLNVAGFGLCMVGFGISHSFWLSFFLLALSGAFDSVSMIIRSTLMQLLTPDAMRGRVSAVASMFIISSNEIGAFESGTAARLLGLVPSVVFGGVCTLIIVAATAWLSPKLRKAAVTAEEAGKKV